MCLLLTQRKRQLETVEADKERLDAKRLRLEVDVKEKTKGREATVRVCVCVCVCVCMCVLLRLMTLLEPPAHKGDDVRATKRHLGDASSTRACIVSRLFLFLRHNILQALEWRVANSMDRRNKTWTSFELIAPGQQLLALLSTRK